MYNIRTLINSSQNSRTPAFNKDAQLPHTKMITNPYNKSKEQTFFHKLRVNKIKEIRLHISKPSLRGYIKAIKKHYLLKEHHLEI